MDVFEALRAAAGDVFADRPVTFAYLFGSHGRRRPVMVDPLRLRTRGFRSAMAATPGAEAP